MKTRRPLAALGLLAGCVGHPMRIDLVTDVGSIDRGQGRRITAQASGFQLFGVLPSETGSRHERAFQALREKAGDDAIADVTLRESWSYAVVGTVFTTTIDAVAYPRKFRP